MSNLLPDGYTEVLADLKARVRSSRLKAMTAVNQELMALYFEIGRHLATRDEVWGSQVVERLAHDLRAEFPDMKGFSRTNLYSMRRVYAAWADAGEIVQQAVGQIPWGHHIVLVGKLDDPDERAWYLAKTIEHGWSRAVLAHQIDTRLRERLGKAITNFAATLPPVDSDAAQQTLKDPYVFDFLDLAEGMRERELERGLMRHVEDFLLELGVGFALCGRQIPVEVANRTYYIDLLFYHIDLRRFVVIELKAGTFEPEFVGKLNFYLSAVDDRFRRAGDAPSIGLLLCKERDKVLVEYALRDMHKPMGVAEWTTRLVESLPDDLKGRLPSVDELEAELSREPGRDAEAPDGEA